MNLSKKQVYIFIAIFILASIAGLIGLFNSENKNINKDKNPSFVLNSVTTVTPGNWYEYRVSPTHLIFTPEPIEEPIEGNHYPSGESISISSIEYSQTPEQWIKGFHDLDDVLVNDYQWMSIDDIRALRVEHEAAVVDGNKITYYLFPDYRVYIISYHRPSYLSGKSSGRVLFNKIVDGQVKILGSGFKADQYTIKNNNVYFITESGEEELIENANPHTFKVLWEPVYEGCRKGMYSKDATDVFYKNELIKNADSESFEALLNGYGKDENNVYLNGKVKSDLDPDTFQSECNYG